MSVPTSLREACSPEWLSIALGAQVTRVTAGVVDDRVSTNARVGLELVDGRSISVWIKGYFTESGNRMRFAGLPEVQFYRELAPRAGVRTPRCYFAEIDPDTSNNVLVTEHVGDDAVFPDGTSPCTPDQTAHSLEQLASLHASTWRREWANADWLASRLELYTVGRGVREIVENFDGSVGSGVPTAVRDAERLHRAYTIVAAEVPSADPWCVVHGDAHIRNIYYTGNGGPSFIDWQLTQRGPWYLDVSYHIATMLSVEERRANESALMTHYLEHLTSLGVEPPSAREVEHGSRLGLIHGFYLWAITLRVPPAATAAILGRLGSAVDDHDAFDAVGV